MLSIQQFPILAASACVRRDEEVLLIQRSKNPGKGKWAFPGGKVKCGETTAHAALRELQEETGLTAAIGPMLGLYEVIHRDIHFAIACYLATDPRGILAASSDAADACWVHVNSISDLPLASNISDAVAASIKLQALR
jgi:8-oxo-dGTP diphosphatase